MKKAISVMSGGLDCVVATCVYAKEYDIHAITFNYGQKSFKEELKASRKVCEKMDFTHSVVELDWLSKISTSSLNTDEDIPEVDFDELDNLEKSNENASSVWVPARNTVFTSIATSFGESIGAEIIIVGWDKEEAGTFPDNSKEYLERFNELLGVGSPQNIRIEAPLIDLNKDEIVKLGHDINSPMELSYSCYVGRDKHCGVCESCMRRKRGFKKAKIKDLTQYEK